MEEIINSILSSFDWKLMISITILSYGTLKILDLFVAKTKKILKKIITTILSTILSFIYFKYLNVSLQEIIPTYLLSIVFYDVIVKKILEFLKIGYKK